MSGVFNVGARTELSGTVLILRLELKYEVQFLSLGLELN